MLEKVEVRSDLGGLLTLSLQDISNGLVVEDIDGLDPVRAVIVSSSFAQMDGEQYQASRREKRNMVIKLKYEPIPGVHTVKGLRNELYKFFMPKSNVSLRFYMVGAPPVDISGRVEDFDSPLFAREPKATITVLAHDPDFVELTPIVVAGSTTDLSTEFLIDYEGTVETGIKFQLNVNRTLDEFVIHHRPAAGSNRMLQFSAPLLAADVLDISTVPGSKSARLTRAGSTSSLLYGISPQSNWIELFPGENYLRVFAEGAAVPFTIEYTNKYGGL